MQKPGSPAAPLGGRLWRIRTPGGAPTVDPRSFVVNGRTYVMPAAPVVVICIDPAAYRDIRMAA
jgi:hypothetical protein